MGMKHDMQQRVTMARIDSHPRRHSVMSARKLIYDKGLAVNSDRIKDLIGHARQQWVHNPSHQMALLMAQPESLLNEAGPFGL